MTHNELVDSLIQSLHGGRQFVVKQPSLGSQVVQRGCPVADILTLRKSYTQFTISVLEVKATRQDFLRDLRAGKWHKYLPYCHRFYWAAPSGIIKKAELTEGAGLWTHGENGWHCVSAGRPRPEADFGPNELLGILFAVGRAETTRVRKWALRDAENAAHSTDAGEAAQVFGQETGVRIARLNELERDARRDRKYYKSLLRKLGEILGLPLGEDLTHIAAEEVRRALRVGGPAADAPLIAAMGRYLQAFADGRPVDRPREKLVEILNGGE